MALEGGSVYGGVDAFRLREEERPRVAANRDGLGEIQRWLCHLPHPGPRAHIIYWTIICVIRYGRYCT